MQKLVGIIILLSTILSCSSEPLDGGCLYFVGKWKWVGYQMRDDFNVTGQSPWPNNLDFAPPTKECTITVEADGKLKVKVEGKLERCSGFNLVSCTSFPSSDFYSMSISARAARSISKDRSTEIGFTTFQGDTILVTSLDIPVAIPQSHTELSRNDYFVRE